MVTVGGKDDEGQELSGENGRAEFRTRTINVRIAIVLSETGMWELVVVVGIWREDAFSLPDALPLALYRCLAEYIYIHTSIIPDIISCIHE